jgi:CheY-like chemotaxis protein
MGSAARALLVEDDASIRRFVQLALEDEPVELLLAETVAQALHRLRTQGPFRLVLTDLMLPDGNGLQVLQALAAEPALRAGARVAVFSAGLSAQTREQLTPLGVDEVIVKPAPLARLLDCLHRALAAPAAPVGSTALGRAIDDYFAGDRALYDRYRQSCLLQFPADRRQGDAAVQAGDWAALRRLAHSLKSVLLTLGHGAESALARQLEADAAAGRQQAARQGWERLAASIDGLSPP